MKIWHYSKSYTFVLGVVNSKNVARIAMSTYANDKFANFNTDNGKNAENEQRNFS